MVAGVQNDGGGIALRRGRPVSTKRAGPPAGQLADRGEVCGAGSNASRFAPDEATFEACTNATLTSGSLGDAQVYHVERDRRGAFMYPTNRD